MTQPRAIVLLCVLGVLSLWLVARLVVGGGGDDPTFIETPTTFDFECMACHHAWTSPVEEAADWYPGGMASDHHTIRCPDCKRITALLKRRCLFCKERYIPTHASWQANSDQDPDTRQPEICTNCNRDVLSFPRP